VFFKTRIYLLTHALVW